MDAVEPSAKTRPADAPAPPDPSLAPHAPADADAPKRGWSRVKHLVVHNILHLDDTPHRIAWGVFWGFVVGATPTIGLQMIIYVAVATVVRANKVSGILPVWLSNPLTAVPLYYTNWMIGRFVMTGETTASEASKEAIQLVIGMPGQDQPLWERLISPEFWSAAFKTFTEMGGELWVGSLLVGVVFGGLGYWATYRGVIAFRHHRAKTHPDPGHTESLHADSESSADTPSGG